MSNFHIRKITFFKLLTETTGTLYMWFANIPKKESLTTYHLLVETQTLYMWFTIIPKKESLNSLSSSCRNTNFLLKVSLFQCVDCLTIHDSPLYLLFWNKIKNDILRTIFVYVEIIYPQRFLFLQRLAT